MGKPTGFLEYTRREDGRRPAAERVRDWDEFHLPLPEEIRRQQGARCMNCGVPFCQEMCIRDSGGRGAGPERPAPLPVVSHYRQAADSLLRGGGAGHPAGEDREEVPAPAGADAAGRPDLSLIHILLLYEL